MINSLNIGGTVYNIIEKEPCTDLIHGGQVCDGEIVYSKNVININSSLQSQQKENTLIHEMVHGILYFTGYEQLRCDEQFVNSFSNVLYQVLKNNDQLVSK